MRLLVSLVLLAAVGACSGAAYRVGSAGVTISLPKGWRFIRMPAEPPPGTPIVDPVTRIVAASGPFDLSKTGCLVATYRFPRTAVSVVVVEWVRRTPGTRFPSRPRRFTARTLPVRPPPAIECFDGPGGSAEFTDGGRRFAAYVLLGRRAPRRLAVAARAVLDTLEVKRKSSHALG
jgi:hypothetical protein